ncbi:hypothetical protein RIF29_29420 [Crotalaria pallida]|uniref:Glycine-rich protein n=1 Tax=Crotalaria pallida TaxID=3830 RepID=A0AAN9EGW0_CROPI
MAKTTSALVVLSLFVIAILNGTTEAAGRGGGDPGKIDLLYGSEKWLWGIWPFCWFDWWLNHGKGPDGPKGDDKPGPDGPKDGGIPGYVPGGGGGPGGGPGGGGGPGYVPGGGGPGGP